MIERILFPDGTPVPADLLEKELPSLEDLGPVWDLRAQGIAPGPRVQTREIQAVIDRAGAEGGGVVAVSGGTFVSGSLYFPRGVHLYLAEDGVLMGSDRVSDYDLRETRIEGERCLYFSALINADHADGFTLMGPGTVDGNGQRAWAAFWLRRKWNPACTNKDEQRPRLLYVSHSEGVNVCGATLKNAHFWTTHFYRCRRVRVIGCTITSPAAPVPAPSTDAIDLDACEEVLIRGCTLSVNDDAIALKGGKGLQADRQPENGPVERVLIEKCDFGFSHSCLTCGSEAIHCRNILMRDCTVRGATNVLRLKMRPDTPQHYENITVERVIGKAAQMLNVHAWSQFADPAEPPAPPSLAERITMRDCELVCDRAVDLDPEERGVIARDFYLEGIRIRAREEGFPPERLGDLYPGSKVEDTEIRLCPQQPRIQTMEIL